jgi:hypothetical protein
VTLHCYRTQFGPANLFGRLPEHDAKQMFSREHFALAWPEPDPRQELDDLLASPKAVDR